MFGSEGIGRNAQHECISLAAYRAVADALLHPYLVLYSQPASPDELAFNFKSNNRSLVATLASPLSLRPTTSDRTCSATLSLFRGSLHLSLYVYNHTP
jgi:hypothetical protein